MQGVHIAPALVEPAAGLVHQTGAVQHPEGLHGFSGIELPPPFVEGHPAGNAGVAPQRLHRVGQLVGVLLPAGRFCTTQQAVGSLPVREAAQQRLQHIGQVGDEPQIIGAAAVDDVLPDDQAQTVAVVIPALRLDLGVLAQQVEAQRFHLAELPLHGCVRGRGIQALRPVALIQQAVEQDGLVVQAEAQHPVGVRCTAPLAQGKVTVHRVELGFLPLVGAHRQVVKEGRVRAPWEEMLFRDVQGHFAVLVGLVAAPVLGDGHAPGPHHGPQVDRTAGLCRVHPHRHRAGVVVRGDGQGLDVVVRHPLQPDGLPDAALGRVEHPAGPEGLLASRLRTGAGGVLHRHPEGVMALRAEQVGNVQRKGPVAAPVSPGQTAIHLHRAGVVHCPEVEQDAPALARWGREGAVVVEPLAGL